MNIRNSVGWSLAVAMLGLFPVSSQALEYRDPVSGFTLTFGGEQAHACVILPVSARDPEACEGLDVAAMEEQFGASASDLKKAGSKPVGGALLWDEETGMVASVMVTTKWKAEPLTIEDARDILNGARGITEEKWNGSASDHETQIVNGLQVLRWVMTGPFAPDVDSILSYMVAGRDHIASLSFLATAAELESVSVLAENVLQTAHLKPTDKPAEWLHGPTRAERIGEACGGMIVNLLYLAAICWGAVYFYRRFIRRRPPDAPPPQP